ncbi:E3 ubiquitin-protein ligase ATL4 [Bienertia sinuspersici]
MVRRKLLDDGKQSGNDVSPSILITVLVLAIAVILSASLYLLLRFFRRHNNHHNHSHPLSSTTRHVSSRRISPANKHHSNHTNNPLVEALPLFTSESLKTSGDCAVCLSKFEQRDLLRLLPICCHVFHADCIDTWLNSNQSCPLCRSPVFLPDSELLPKLTPHEATSSASSGSFRVEIGNVSRRNSNSGEIPVRRSYSLGGNFDYIVDDDVVSEVHSGSFRRTSSTTEFKVDSDNQQGNLAAEVGTRGGGGGGGWLKDYLSHSLSSSFRSSGRWFFTGSSRRETPPTSTATTTTNEFVASEMDLEASRLGDEIGELFRWLSGV